MRHGIRGLIGAGVAGALGLLAAVATALADTDIKFALDRKFEGPSAP